MAMVVVDGGLTAQVNWLGLSVSSHLVLSASSSWSGCVPL